MGISATSMLTQCTSLLVSATLIISSRSPSLCQPAVETVHGRDGKNDHLFNEMMHSSFPETLPSAQVLQINHEILLGLPTFLIQNHETYPFSSLHPSKAGQSLRMLSMVLGIYNFSNVPAPMWLPSTQLNSEGTAFSISYPHLPPLGSCQGSQLVYLGFSVKFEENCSQT